MAWNPEINKRIDAILANEDRGAERGVDLFNLYSDAPASQQDGIVARIAFDLAVIKTRSEAA